MDSLFSNRLVAIRHSSLIALMAADLPEELGPRSRTRRRMCLPSFSLYHISLPVDFLEARNDSSVRSL